MRFIVTDELGRLLRWLRILGFDTVLEKNRSNLVMRSLREGRIILTRDSRSAPFTGTGIVRIDSDFVEEQLEQLIKKLNLKIDRNNLFSICVLCNEPLEPAAKDSVKDQVPQLVFQTQENFMRCPKCQKIYWRGTHWALVNKFLDRISE
jgi:uncharacterized protein with PIN domain